MALESPIRGRAEPKVNKENPNPPQNRLPAETTVRRSGLLLLLRPLPFAIVPS